MAEKKVLLVGDIDRKYFVLVQEEYLRTNGRHSAKIIRMNTYEFVAHLLKHLECFLQDEIPTDMPCPTANYMVLDQTAADEMIRFIKFHNPGETWLELDRITMIRPTDSYVGGRSMWLQDIWVPEPVTAA